MATTQPDYNFTAIEAHWQERWEQAQAFRAADDSTQPKFYILAMYPYPSGAGLHIGHSIQYTAPDVLTRYMQAKGHNALQPMGWDAFGLPTEQTAVQTGEHPRLVTERNVANFTRQLKKHGFAIDWEREINTTDPDYVRWTQWIFLSLFKHGLAYVDEKPVWWCPALGTVLANEEVIEGKSERGSHPVERRALRQWVLRITAYAEKLLDGLKELDWPESTLTLQRNWIGRSEGAEVVFALADRAGSITVFTTRPDTLFGATYMVLAPEHPLVTELTSREQREAVDAYVEAAARKSDLDRTDLAKDKSGVFTGSYAINPVNNARIPIWVADYVLMGYGTGAIMAVPAHDERDYEFAEKFALPIPRVIQGPEGEDDLPYAGAGTLVNSGEFDGMPHTDAKQAIVSKLEADQRGKLSINYKLRDWLFSRQRYWGEPFPIVWVEAEAYAAVKAGPSALQEFLPEEAVTYIEDGTTYYAVPLPDMLLPLQLPEVEDFKPSGEPEGPLAKATDWVHIWLNLETGEAIPASQDKPQGHWAKGRRETNTMPQWAGSCWYHMRYLDPRNTDKLIDPQIERYWQRPDIYTGGQEHAVLHLLYARFWHRFLYEIGAVQYAEPYPKLIHQGMVLGEDSQKMSKSRGNVINPDEMIGQYGADALRLYLMFMGPYEEDKPWNTGGLEGINRFLRRLWREFLDREGQASEKVSGEDDRDTLRVLHETILKVTEGVERWRFNTCIAQMMILLNQIQKAPSLSRQSAITFLQLLNPFAPHIAEELHERLGGTTLLSTLPWPQHDEQYLQSDTVKIGLLVNGKPRAEASVAPDASEADVLAIAQADEKVAAHLDGKTLRKVIYKPGKIINIVAS